MPYLYLLRHGIAFSEGSDPGLSEEGTRLMQAEAKGMQRLGLRFDLILSSPLKRAEQTARIVADHTRVDDSEVMTDESLGPGCRLESVAGFARRHSSSGNVLLVGHQPDMGLLAGRLAGSKRPLPFGRGTLCGIEVGQWEELAEAQSCSLQLLLTSRILTKLGS